MRKKICFKANKPYLQNRLFEEKGDLNFFFKLKNLLDSRGYLVGTQDMVDEKKSIFVIYLDNIKDFKIFTCFNSFSSFFFSLYFGSNTNGNSAFLFGPRKIIHTQIK